MSNIKVERRQLLRRAALSTAGLALAPMAGSLAHAEGSGGTLTIALPNNPITIDPINQLNHDAMVLGQTVFENLIETDVDGNLRPQLARELPVISADGKRYTFDLRDDVSFHNGQKMTAEDVKYSFEYMLNPDNKATRRGIFTRISKVTVLSPTRVQIDLSEPYAPWLHFLTKYMGIFPAGSREKFGGDHFKSGPAGVGTGVGMFEEWKPNDYVSFRRNPNYWRKELPKWDRLVARIMPDDAARVSYLLTGQADIISAPPPREFTRLKMQAPVTGASRPTLGGWFVFYLNNKKPPFDDANFRKAMSCALDRQSIAEKVYFGLLDPSAVPAPTRGWWFDKAANDSVSFNLARAREFLAKSKYPSGAEFDLWIPSEPYLLDVKDAAVVVQAQLSQVGIRANIKPMELMVMMNPIYTGEHTAGLAVAMSPGEPTYLIQLTMTPGQVLSKSTNYTNPEIEDLLRQTFLDENRERLKPIYARMLQVIAADMPMVWLGFVHASNLWRQNVKNFVVNQGLTMSVHDVSV
jgi:peptide/nickel transport system substrate-binding protein